MSADLRRRLAELTCRSLCALLPRHLRSWGEAVRADVAEIPDDDEALRYALGSLFGLLPRALSIHIGSPVLGDPSLQSFSRRRDSMSAPKDPDFNPRRLFLICAAAAVFLGLAALWMADAPLRYLAINFLALPIGYALLAILDRFHPRSMMGATVIPWMVAAALLVTAMVGQPVEGASRWFRVAGLSVQTSLILLPLAILCFARASTLTAAGGIALSALAIALQPDRGMAGVLAAGLLAIAVVKRDAISWAAAFTGAASLAATIAQPDQLPAVPHVDQVLYTAFGVHPVAGLAVLTGSLLLVAPAAIAWARDPGERVLHAALGSVWLAAIAAAALGNYPTPVVGYGGSAIIGYILALAGLRTSAADGREGSAAERRAKAPEDEGPNFCASLTV